MTAPAPLGLSVINNHIAKRAPSRHDNTGFQVLARRWVVERTIAWLTTNRRLAKDYERLVEAGEMLLYFAMSRILLRRLTSALCGTISEHGFGLEKLLEAETTPFTAIAGLLIAAEGCRRVATRTIDVDHASTDAPGDPTCPLDIA